MNHAETLVLVIDDDRPIVSTLCSELESEAYQTIDASDGNAAIYQITNNKPDLILLDLNLPELDGMVLLGRIRKISNAGIIILSARHSQADVIVSLQNGADDFIHKPFDLDDLFARCEAVIRRSQRLKVQSPYPDQSVFKSFSVSPSRGLRVDNVLFHTTPTEQKIIGVLIEQQGQTSSKTTIAQKVFGYSDNSSGHLIDVHVGRLRKKLGSHGGKIGIQTACHARGYYLGEPFEFPSVKAKSA